MFRLIPLLYGLAALLLWGSAQAADKAAASTKNVSFVPSANAALPPPESRQPDLATAASEPLVFSAPPRESLEEAQQIYQPIADYFARILGRKVTYQHPKSWLSYQQDVAKGAYDILFDEAHFNSWSISRHNRNTLAKIADENFFVVVTRRDNNQVATIKQLAGKKICTLGATNLGTLALLAEFEPMRQPFAIESGSWAKVYEGVMEGRCVAATLPVAMLRKLDGNGGFTSTIHRTRALPNYVFSAGWRVSPEQQSKLTTALVSADSKRVLGPLLSANGAEKGLAQASKEDYAGMDVYLKDVWGYGR